MLLLKTIRRQMFWILWKVYGGEDLAFLSNTCTRIQSVLHYLVKVCLNFPIDNNYLSLYDNNYPC